MYKDIGLRRLSHWQPELDFWKSILVEILGPTTVPFSHSKVVMARAACIGSTLCIKEISWTLYWISFSHTTTIPLMGKEPGVCRAPEMFAVSSEGRGLDPGSPIRCRPVRKIDVLLFPVYIQSQFLCTHYHFGLYWALNYGEPQFQSI